MLKKAILFLAYKSFQSYLQDPQVKSVWNFVEIWLAGNNRWSLLSTYLLCLDTILSKYVHTYICVHGCVSMCNFKPHKIPMDYYWHHFTDEENEVLIFSYWSGKRYIKMASFRNIMIGDLQIYTFNISKQPMWPRHILWRVPLRDNYNRMKRKWAESRTLESDCFSCIYCLYGCIKILSLTWPQIPHLSKEELGLNADLCNLETSHKV